MMHLRTTLAITRKDALDILLNKSTLFGNNMVLKLGGPVFLKKPGKMPGKAPCLACCGQL